MRTSLGGACLALLAATATASLQIVSGATWTASNGKHVQAHGAGIIKVDNTWYMIGEDKTEGSAFHNINCYSSTNLIEWTYVGALLSRQGSGDLGPSRVVERPKVIYNSNTKQYVMWMHIDSSDYKDAKTGVATSSSVCGSYSYRGGFRPNGHQSRDMGLFKDDDGTGYLLSEDRENGLRIMKLSADYLTIASETYRWNEKYEAPAVVKKNGVYFMFTSKLSGWDPNDNIYSTSTSMSGPWSGWKTFADSGSKTYSSQTTFVLPVGDTIIYMGDRWHSGNLMRSTYVWLPLSISGTTASMKNYVNWQLDVAKGTWAAGPSETTYEGESATLSNGARSINCEKCSGKKAAGYIGGDQTGTAVFAQVSSSAATRSTIRINYANGNSAERYADVSVNGQTKRVAFVPSPDGNTPIASVLHADLREGNNEIRISASGGWGPDVDRLMVPLS
ncbi:carbohydrate-binding module family 35 protein [Patellaria atrata CBS 101060]|uniref:Carbohydrate-binding module family 35 protein n=1 Tax=Patellaria atrata CBS 101060 TaxID=1346257 RepID=A0A9P4SHG4_9PEZI|nr:carbohydrate-binding module family 35 protein [Patellaria atrata CBS 101060]